MGGFHGELDETIKRHLYASVLLTLPRWFALIRIWSPWLAPRQGKSTFALDKDAVMCSFLSQTGKHLVLMGISGVGDVMTLFQNDNDGNVVIHVSTYGRISDDASDEL